MSIQAQAHPCAVCGEKRPENFRSYFDSYLKLYRCQTCSFVAQYPGPGQYTIIEDYAETEHFTTQFATEEKRKFKYPGKQTLRQDVVRRIKRHGGGGKLLDVGCGDGHFLDICVENGFTGFGVEPTAAVAEHAKQQVNAEISAANYERELFPESSFDVITFIQVLEHIPVPLSALETAYYHLRPGGLLVIEVPSIHSPHFLLYQWTGIKWFVRPPKGIIQSHVNYFSPKTLLMLLEKANLNELEVTTSRWKQKYHGLLGAVARITDPIFNQLRIGGILIIAQKP